MKTKISVLPTPFKRGSSSDVKKAYAAKHSNKPIQKDFSIEEFAAWVGSGKGFTQYLFEDGAQRKGANALGSQIVALDFDENSPKEGSPALSIKGVVDYLKSLNIAPNVVYKSTSYKFNKQKFRVIWMLDKEIEQIECKRLITFLVDQFFNKKSDYVADGATKDTGRFFLGGYDAEVVSYDQLQYEFIKSTIISELATEKSTGSDRSKRNQQKKYLELYDLPTKMGHSNNTTIKMTEIGKQGIDLDKGTINHPFNIERACSISTVFKDFIEGKGQWLTYSQQFNLMLTLFKFKGGPTLMREKLLLYNDNAIKDGRPEDIYQENRFDAIRFWASQNYGSTMFEYSSYPLNQWFDESLDDSYVRLSDLNHSVQKGVILKNKIETISLDRASRTLKRMMDGVSSRDGDFFNEMVTRVYVPSHSCAKGNKASHIAGSDADNQETILEEVKKMVCIIRADTGLGKTENYLQSKGTVIAFPNHKLKNEVLARMEAAGNEVYAVPKTPRFSVEEHNETIKKFKSMQSHTKVAKYIKDIQNKRTKLSRGKNQTDVDNDAKLARDYIIAKNNALSASGDATVLTTHSLAIYIGNSENGFKQKSIIFDENPRSSLLENKSFSEHDFNAAFFHLYADERALEENRDLFTSYEETLPTSKGGGQKMTAQEKADHAFKKDLDVLRRWLNGLKNIPNKPKDAETIVFHRKSSFINRLADYDIGESIISFIEADVWQSTNDKGWTFRSVKKHRLPEEKEVTILSATIEEWEFEALGYKTFYLGMKPVENAGKVVQDASSSTSRQALRNQKRVNELNDKIGEVDDVITYKGQAEKFGAEGATYFGNTAGFDGLSGGRIAIVGDNRLSPVDVALWMHLYGFEPQSDWQTFKNGVYEDEHFKYSFYRSNDDNVNKIITSFIREEQTQAIGRARVIRQPDAEVTIFSSFPSPNADEIEDKRGDVHKPRDEEQ